ncbi:MAG: metallophosphoesterase family protein [Myxococcales bacterium]|nr:MAG: metallophosphoesterase family protein [Myxococcales bacterium]
MRARTAISFGVLLGCCVVASGCSDSKSQENLNDAGQDAGSDGAGLGDGSTNPITSSCIEDLSVPDSCGDGSCDENELCGNCAHDCGACADSAPSVLRGPYLQVGTTSSVIVKWRTLNATDSVVAYGLSPDTLSWVTRSDTNTTEHEVTLSDLCPYADYYYAIGSSTATLVGGDADHVFRTSPEPGQIDHTRIWMIGDSGQAGSGQRAVRDHYLQYTGEQGTDVWIMLGDNAYSNGTDQDFQDAVFDPSGTDGYAELLRQQVVWPTIGNHEHTGNSNAPYFDIFTLPTQGEAGGVPSGTERHYAFDYGDIHFVVLDSDTESNDSDALSLLEIDLQANDKTWLIAYWHHPPYSNGAHKTDDEGAMTSMRENFVPLLESYGVDLVFTGHSHSYERSALLYGHYDTSDTLDKEMVLARNSDTDWADGDPDSDGAYLKSTDCIQLSGQQSAPGTCGSVYSVVGSSSKISDSDFPTRYNGGVLMPMMITYQKTMGSVVIDISGNTADVVFLDAGSSGNPDYVISDHYQLVKP